MRSTWKICNTSDLPPREGQAGCTPAAPRLARSGHQVQAEKRLAWGAFADHQHGIASSSLSKVYDTHMILGVTWSLQVPCLQCDLLHSCGRWYAKHLESRTGPARHQTLCPQMFPFGLFSSIFFIIFWHFQSANWTLQVQVKAWSLWKRRTWMQETVVVLLDFSRICQLHRLRSSPSVWVKLWNWLSCREPSKNGNIRQHKGM